MNAITCCCAPAPIESIETTAATPKIIPSIVSSDRSLCSSRLSTRSRKLGKKSAPTHASAPDGAEARLAAGVVVVGTSAAADAEWRVGAASDACAAADSSADAERDAAAGAEGAAA